MSLELPTYEDLSKEQDAVLNLPLDKSHLVTGPPGSGKTVMAIYRAKALKNRFGEDSQLLMYGRVLSQYTQRAVQELDVQSNVSTFHSWFPKWYSEAYPGERPDMIDRWTFDWAKVLRRMSRKTPVARLKRHLIVDEGQDFPRELYLVLRFIADTMTVFADENQMLTDTNSTLQMIREDSDIVSEAKLTGNYRNTPQIAAVAARFHEGIQTGIADVPADRASGPKPVLQRHAGIQRWVEWLKRYEQANSTRSIGVFLPMKKHLWASYKALEGETKGPLQMYISGDRTHNSIDMAKAGIKLLSYASAKGLEFDTVMIPGLSRVPIQPNSPSFGMQFYVLTSRAKRELWFHHDRPGSNPVVNVLPLDLMEER